MTETGWVQLINDEGYSQRNVGTALSNSVALTDISPGGNVAGQAFVIPASYMYPGLQLRVRARGVYSTTGQPNLTLGVYYGGVAGTALATTTFTASANATNLIWSMEADIRCDAVGTAASLRTLGAASGLSSSGPVMIPASSGSGSVATVASGVSNILTVGAQWGTQSSSNSIQVLQYLVEQLN